ncbi:MAG: S49 family peptidase [Bacteroidales bacterium]|nr:S49 family peptidase [Bacteroidales bacterium]
MDYTPYINEILTSGKHGRSISFLSHYQSILNYIENPASIQGIEREELKILAVTPNGVQPYDDFKPEPENDGIIAIVPIRGTMTRYGSWFRYGMEEVAEMLLQLYADPDIKGIILDTDTPGGTVNSMQILENALEVRNKRVDMLVNLSAFSAGFYVRCLCDNAYATHRNASVGNIGIRATIQDDSELLKKWGLKIIDVIPPQSKFKGKAFDDAKDGNSDALIKEYLEPLAEDFQKLVREACPNLDESVEGILEGKDFFATDAVKYGLITGIKSRENLITEMLSDDTYNMSQILNN